MGRATTPPGAWEGSPVVSPFQILLALPGLGLVVALSALPTLHGFLLPSGCLLKEQTPAIRLRGHCQTIQLPSLTSPMTPLSPWQVTEVRVQTYLSGPPFKQPHRLILGQSAALGLLSEPQEIEVVTGGAIHL